MKRLLVLCAALAALMGSVAVIGQVARAKETPMTEAHVARIRANCVEAQSALRQIHQSDVLMRINRGQLYEQISTKLMAPLNSRIALNRLDSADLVSTTAKYEKQLGTFRSAYQSYDKAMNDVLKMNCTAQPVAFFDAVGDARSKRKKVHEATLTLQQTIKEYKTEFESFSKTVNREAK